MPTRLLDVGVASSQSVRLVLSVDPEDIYVALSHCWGQSIPLVTTSKNISSSQLEITSKLPKTFADAVRVTRRLGIRYLWIDALCIIQDDPDDWLRESATMASVYGNSDITIVASRSSSSMEGFLSPRHEICVSKKETDSSGHEINVFLVNRDYYNNSVSVASEPLWKRAWVIQERYLSRRKVLFGEAQLFWECNETTRSEDTQITMIHSQDDRSRSLPWYDIVEYFTKCDITCESDSLPAISGIAKTVARMTGGTHCAGIWLNQLSYSLLWYPQQNGSHVFRKIRREAHIAPSFSWAASQGPARCRAPFQTIMGGRLCEYVSHGQTLRVENSDPYGAIEDAWIKLKAPLVQVCRIIRGAGFEIYLELQLRNGKKYVTPPIFDREEAKIPPNTFILPLYYDETRMQALLLVRTSERQDCTAFRRIVISYAGWYRLQKLNWWAAELTWNRGRGRKNRSSLWSR